jgi:hypothetical protein
VVGACALGMLELGTLVHRAFIMHSLDADPPVWAALRVVLALAAGAYVFLGPKTRR